MEQDQEYYRRYLAGDGEALSFLIEKYRDRLIFFLRRFLRSPDDAEEVAAECFAELAIHPLRYRFAGSVKTYLFSIGRHKALNLCKRQEKLLPLETAELSPEYRTFEEEIFRREEARQLHCAINRLPEDYRTVLHLLYFEELSYEEAARIMKKSRKQIDNLAYRAKRSLKALLEKEGNAL